MQILKQAISQKDSLNIFAILDGAAINGLLDKLYQWRPAHVCLFRGKLAPDMAEVAPYLVRLEDRHQFTNWLLDNCEGNHWGIFFSSPLDERKLRRKFRNMLNAQLPDGSEVMFRYYDPRIMNSYLPSCNQQELETLYESIDSYFVEDGEIEQCRQYRLYQGNLINLGTH